MFSKMIFSKLYYLLIVLSWSELYALISKQFGDQLKKCIFIILHL